MSETGRFDIAWIDKGYEPQCAPDPAFPNGQHIDGSMGAAQTCTIDLPYPAKRCGMYVAICLLCGVRVGATTAGRPDDPRSVKIACKDLHSA